MSRKRTMLRNADAEIDHLREARTMELERLLDRWRNESIGSDELREATDVALAPARFRSFGGDPE